MDRRTRRREAPASALTAEERELLGEFDRRRAGFAAALEASNIIHHRHTCAACGFPSVDDEDSYPWCIVCGWEPYGGASLTQDRIYAAKQMRRFELLHALAGTIDDIVRAIKAFEARHRASKVSLIDEDFIVHLCNVVPTRPRSP